MPLTWMPLLQHLDGDLTHQSMVEEAPAIGDLAAHEDVADNRHRVDEGRVLIDCLDADVFAVASGIHDCRGAVDENLAVVRSDNSRHHLDQGGLAGAIVAEKSDHFAGANMEVQIRKRLDVAITLRHAPDFINRAIHRRNLLPATWLKITAITISAPTKMSR